MRTNVTLDEALVHELMTVSGAKTKTAAVVAAVKEQIRRARRKQLADLLGSIDVDHETLANGRRADAERDGILHIETGNND